MKVVVGDRQYRVSRKGRNIEARIGEAIRALYILTNELIMIIRLSGYFSLQLYCRWRIPSLGKLPSLELSQEPDWLSCRYATAGEMYLIEIKLSTYGKT